MYIDKVEAIIVDLPLVRPHKLAMTVMQEQTLVVVRITCSDGITGIGEATPIGGLSYGDQCPEGIKVVIDSYVAPLLTGKSSRNINTLMTSIGQQVQGQSFAKSAIETALLDIEGKRLGLPVHALLGGALRDQLPVLWTLASGDAARDVEEAQEMIARRRHNAFKLKVGRRSVEADVAHVRQIRKALPADVMVTVDVNQAWDETQAVRGLAALQAAGVSLVEQPVSRRNRAAMVRLTNRFEIPILMDEGVTDSFEAFELACAGAQRAFALKISKAGGLSETLRVAAIARAAGVGLYGGTLLEGTIGTIAATHAFAVCHRLEWGTELFGPLLMADDIVTALPDYRDCSIGLPDAPGLGVEIDDDKLAHYRRDRTRTTHGISAQKAGA